MILESVRCWAGEPAGDFTGYILRVSNDAMVVVFRAAQAWSQIPWFLRMDIARMTDPGNMQHAKGLTKLPLTLLLPHVHVSCPGATE